jgi:hypothetical protein
VKYVKRCPSAPPSLMVIPRRYMKAITAMNRLAIKFKKHFGLHYCFPWKLIRPLQPLLACLEFAGFPA